MNLRSFSLTFLLSVACYGIDLDPQTLQEIIQNNPQAYKEKILLAKYYEKHDNDLKAIALLQDVLQQHPKDSHALALEHLIKKKQADREVFKEANLSLPIQKQAAQKRLETYYNNGNYQLYSKLYQALIDNKITLDDSHHIKAAYIYLWDARYNLSKKTLTRVEQKNNIDTAKITADLCYYQGDYRCAAKLFEKLYHTSYQLDYAIKLINSYIYLGNTSKAKRLYQYLQRRYTHNAKLEALGKKLTASQNTYLHNTQAAYENNPNYETLEAYTIALNDQGKFQKAIDLVHQYNTQHVDKKSLLLEAKYLLWAGKTKKAMHILMQGSLQNDLKAKLMIGQIYSWDHQFQRAKAYLDEVIQKAQSQELHYQAYKARAFVALWENDRKKAQEMFQKLAHQKPQDKEVQEALMELRHDYKALLHIYEKKAAQTKNPQDIKRVAELYAQTKQTDKAIQYLKKYLQKNPQDLEANKELALLLINKKEYYQGFGYLEYYAAQKQDLQSALLLAKNYYWNGFSKEALDVLDQTLKKHPHAKEALQLKAKILKISPRFTTSNSGATIQSYFDKLGNTQLQLADTLYFNAHYKASLLYYQAYLQQHPNNHDVRYRYAFALENAKEYALAEGEFSLLFWTKDSDELRYHYAYNMMKNHKLKKAKVLLLKLKKESFHTIDPALQTFVEQWKAAWQSQNFQKYAQFYTKNYTQDEMWSFRKQQTFANVKFISVAIFSPLSKEVDTHHYIVKFYQEYATDKRSDKGYKTLHIQCAEKQTECKITKELWKAGEYKKPLILTPYIDNALKEIQRLEALPLALRYTKKKMLHT